jgi:hypothetical protein
MCMLINDNTLRLCNVELSSALHSVFFFFQEIQPTDSREYEWHSLRCEIEIYDLEMSSH